jgi:hypothetical protein
MVMEVEILLRGIPSNSSLVSSTVSMATPAMPTSPVTRGLSESYLPQYECECETHYHCEIPTYTCTHIVLYYWKHCAHIVIVAPSPPSNMRTHSSSPTPSPIF